MPKIKATQSTEEAARELLYHATFHDLHDMPHRNSYYSTSNLDDNYRKAKIMAIFSVADAIREVAFAVRELAVIHRGHSATREK